VILTVSERTDIPAFYSEWFFERLQEGFCDVRNPFSKKITRISLRKEDVDAFIFTTKNPLPMFSRLDELNGYPCLFQITITPYDRTIEKNVINKNMVIDGFKYLSKRYGKHACILRYDPILLNDRYTIEEHEAAFRYCISQLHEYTDLCLFSFVSMYKNTKSHQHSLKIKQWDQQTINQVAFMLSTVAKEYGIRLQCCASNCDLSRYGIAQAACINNQIISRLLNYQVDYESVSKRENCSCITHRDIGAYNSCMHLCTYCYANYDEKIIQENIKRHNLHSSLLLGEIEEDELDSLLHKETQLRLF